MNISPPRKLNTLAEIKRYFADNATPYYFVSATNFNLMGMHEWVCNWLNIALIDCYDGRHPQVLTVEDDHTSVFESIEDIARYLLSNAEARARLAAQPGRVLFLFFDETLEALCRALNQEIALPPNRLVREIDSKIVTTELGNAAGVPSVPNVLSKVTSYADLQRIAEAAGLGERWVVQTAYGDSGKTTFFIADEADYLQAAAQIEAEDQVKIMRWIRCAGTAIEACATRWGTFVGPLLTELIGIDALTPYPGGWCGNELYDAAFSPEIRRDVLRKTQAIGDALYRRGYRGYFELDYLLDLDSDAVYLGELNARITGISAMTNMSDFSAAHLPLFLFHLLEYDPGVDLGLNVDAFNQMVLSQGARGVAAQTILKYTDEALKIVVQAPASGVYIMDDGGELRFKHPSYRRRDALAENEAYILRIMNRGDYAYCGGDLAIMFLNCAIRNADGGLNPDGARWVAALQRCFEFRHLDAQERAAVALAHHPANIKSGRES